MKNKFRSFLIANLEPSLFHNKQYYEALSGYYRSGIRPNVEKLMQGVLNAKKTAYYSMIDKEYFEKSVVVINSSEKELDSRFDNMLKRIDIFKTM